MPDRDPVPCPYCGDDMPYESPAYVCEPCDIEWTANIHSVSQDVRNRTKRRRTEDRAYRRYKAWQRRRRHPLVNLYYWLLPGLDD